MQPGEVGRRRAVVARGTPRSAEGLVAAVHQRPIERGLAAGQRLEEVGTLRKLIRRRRGIVLRADFPLAGEDDAGRLVRGEPGQLVRFAVKNVLPRLPRKQKVEVAAVGVALPVAIVDQHLNPALGGFRVDAIHRRAHHQEHGVPGGHEVRCAEDLGDAEFQVIEIDIGAAAVGGQEAAAPILRLAVRGLRLRAGARLDARRRPFSAGSRVRIGVVEAAGAARAIEPARVRDAGNFAQEQPGGHAGRVPGPVHAAHHVADLHVRAAELGHGAAARRCPPLGFGAAVLRTS